MKIKLTLRAFDLPLRHPFTISRGTTTVQPTLIVDLAEGPLHGYGEATENGYYGHSVASMSRSLEAVRPRIEAHVLVDPELLWEELHSVLAADPFALCAL